MKAFYSDTFELPLPAGHRFPIEKYRMLRKRLQLSAFRDRLQFCLPFAATDKQLLMVHTADYLDKLNHGTLSRAEERRIGFPWSPEMVELSSCDIVFYLAGADPYEQDRLGKLKLTMRGLAERDRLVFASGQSHEIPVTLVMAGGYAPVIGESVAINAMTIRKLLEVSGRT